MADLLNHPATSTGDPSSFEIMDRRGFLERSAVMAALALLAGACGDQSLTGPTFDAPVLVDLAAYPALAAVGGAARIDGVSPPVAVVHLGEGSYAALSLSCPHRGTTVQWTGSGFRCPNHGATFANDGAWTGGERTSALRGYPTEYDAVAGTLLISPR